MSKGVNWKMKNSLLWKSLICLLLAVSQLFVLSWGLSNASNHAWDVFDGIPLQTIAAPFICVAGLVVSWRILLSETPEDKTQLNGIQE